MRKFKGETLRELVYEDLPKEDGYEIVEKKLVDTSRWSTNHSLVFTYQGKYYQTSYSVGATENQCEEPFEYNDEVECAEVHPVEKTVIVYEVVKH